jgi:hypothetical protein
MSENVQELVEKFRREPFYMDSNIDVSGWSPERKQALAIAQGRKQPTRETGDDGFGLHPEIIRSPKDEFTEMMKDPSVRAELARRDPVFMEQYKADEAEEIMLAFRRLRPEYVRSQKNASAMFRTMAQKYLGKDYLNNEETLGDLQEAGYWTVDKIDETYQALLRAGRLDVPPKTSRELTHEEKLDVIAAIRTGDVEYAVIQYVTYAFGGNLPEDYLDPRDFLKKNASLASKAVLFCWFHLKAGTVDSDEFKEFHAKKLSRVPLLTVQLVEDAWRAWKETKKRPSFLFGTAVSEPEPQTPQEPEDLDSLPDAEIDRRILQARKVARGRL